MSSNQGYELNSLKWIRSCGCSGMVLGTKVYLEGGARIVVMRHLGALFQHSHSRFQFLSDQQ